MRAGKLRHYVDIEEYVKTGSGNRGQKTGSWQVMYGNVPAAITVLAGREAETARQLVATVTHSVLIRYHPDLTTRKRVVYDDRVFEIGHVANIDERNLWVELLVTEEDGHNA